MTTHDPTDERLRQALLEVVPPVEPDLARIGDRISATVRQRTVRPYIHARVTRRAVRWFGQAAAAVIVFAAGAWFGGTGQVMESIRPLPQGGSAVDNELGFTLRCPGCELGLAGDAPAWTVSAYPVVASVEPGGVADEAGLRPGDEIREVDGVDVRATAGRSPLFALPPLDFTLTYSRDGKIGSALMNRRITNVIEIRDGIRVRPGE